MKIAWFTPVDKRSAIGKVSLTICERLSKDHLVDIWGYEKENILETDLNIIAYDPSALDVKALKRYDYIVYNMGNYAGYHWAIYEVMLRVPGILILHDRTMHFFFKQYCAIKYGAGSDAARTTWLQMLRNEYGSIGERIYEIHDSSSVMEQNEQIAAVPFLRLMCDKAAGVFTHTFSFAEQLRSVTIAPVGAAYLPYEPKFKRHQELPTFFARDPKKLLIVSNGIVQPNKHIKDLADVLKKNDDLRNAVQYVVIGDCSGPYGDELKEMASGSLSGCLFMMGYQPYDVMESFLQSADLCVNMRYPNSEVCSLSLFEQMGYGKAVIAFNSGIFGEMPEDSIIKLDLNRVEDSLTNMLRSILRNKEQIALIGERAKKFIVENCNIDLYCEKLISYMNILGTQQMYASFIKNTLSDLQNEMKLLGFNAQAAPEALDDIAYTTSRLLAAQPSYTFDPETIGIWIGFPYHIGSLHREGIMRLMSRMLSAMIEYTPLKFEVWTYDCNAEEVKQSFQSVLNCPDKRVILITETTWTSLPSVSPVDLSLHYSPSIDEDNLGLFAAKYSRARVFIPVILYLDNVLQTKRPICIPALDMSMRYHYESFVYQDTNSKFQIRDFESRVGRMVRHGARAYTLSKTLCEEQIVPCILGLEPSKIEMIWTPDMMTNSQSVQFSKSVLEKYHISGPYLFYPTQLRAHKSIETLMDAMEILYEEYPNLQIVLTGKLEDVPNVHEQWKKRRSYKNLVFASDVSDEDLYCLYHYASCVPVTTLMEGGFPSQAIEALRLDVPLVLANIKVVQERLEGCGMTAADCGLMLFQPGNAQKLAEKIRNVLTNPAQFLDRQRAFMKVFSSYTWKEAAQKYYNMLMKCGAKQ